MKPVQIYISGGSALFPILVTSAIFLKQHIHRQYPGCAVVYNGGSSGSLVALIMALDLTLSEVEHVFRHEFWDRLQSPCHVFRNILFHSFFYAKRVICRLILLRPDWKTRVCGKLRIKVSVFDSGGIRSHDVDSFSDINDLVDTVMTSCHLLFFIRWPFKIYRGKLCFDGAYFNYPNACHAFDSFIMDYSHIPPNEIKTRWSLPSQHYAQWRILTNVGLKYTGRLRAKFDSFMTHRSQSSIHKDPSESQISFLSNVLVYILDLLSIVVRITVVWCWFHILHNKNGFRERRMAYHAIWKRSHMGTCGLESTRVSSFDKISK